MKNNVNNELKRFHFETSMGNQSDSNQRASIGSKTCMTDLGCFEITKDFFHPIYRPVNFLPQDKETVHTRFLLYMRSNPKEHHELHSNKPDEIKNSLIKPEYKTVFIIHGFFDSRFYGKWMEMMKDNLLLNNDYNVIIVDWSKGNGPPYTQATANCRVVGAEVAFLIKQLEEIKGVSPMNCHIIGHSLGAHIAGYAGERLNKLGRISGLDPAHPYFQFMPPSVRLDPTDADFVDNIHTDSGSHKLLPLGMIQLAGHIDFFPNNGMSQPGCAKSVIHSILLEGLIDASRRFIACNHQRAVDYFMFSINYKKALQVAYQCTSWHDYIRGHCAECGKDGSKCAILGIQADQYKRFKNDTQSIKMYLTTTGSAPFWEYYYKVEVKLRKPKENFEDKKGSIMLQFHGTSHDYNVQLTTKTGNLIHGATYTYLVRHVKELGELLSVKFSWASSSWNFFKTHTLFLDYVTIKPMNVIDERKQEYKQKFCYESVEAIESKKEYFLKESTQGLLTTDLVILNYGQVTRTTPGLAPTLLACTPHQQEDVGALDRFNGHPPSHTAGLQRHLAQTHDMPATSPLP
ncbi:pancreatic lipase-related protein 2 [Trichonephila clavipes]|nr:pancreatic lipase-related protein 2 [Trichonephila clavipes]